MLIILSGAADSAKPKTTSSTTTPIGSEVLLLTMTSTDVDVDERLNCTEGGSSRCTIRGVDYSASS